MPTNRERRIKHVKMWLGCLRRHEYPYTLYLQFLREEVKEGLFLLEDIGTNEAELHALCKKGSEVSARVWLEHIRKDPDNSRSVQFLAQEIRRGGLTHTQLGITWDELMNLPVMAAAAIIKP